MKIEDKINNYLNEKSESIGETIEDLDMTVEKKDRKKFDKILNKALNKIDPNNELTIKDAVNNMNKRDAKYLLDDLLTLHYDD